MNTQLDVTQKQRDAAEAFLKFVQVIAKLRDPNGGCPWDLKQTHSSLKPYLVEEAYEVLEAIDHNPAELYKELGDVLLQVVLHCQVATDDGRFDIGDTIRAVTEKMIHRHPHVFGDKQVSGAEEVLSNWEAIKKKDLPAEQSILDGVPGSMPGLLRAQRVGEKAARVGFEWPTLEGVRDKVFEEMNEFLQCVTEKQSSEKLEDEFGDILFALVQLARRTDINAEGALNGATTKFVNRFKAVERKAAGKDLSKMSIDELDRLWEEVKAEQRAAASSR